MFYAGVAELADAWDLKSHGGFPRTGSIPVSGRSNKYKEKMEQVCQRQISTSRWQENDGEGLERFFLLATESFVDHMFRHSGVVIEFHRIRRPALSE